MILRTHVRDCLYLNWALPAAKLAPPPAPLRYDVRERNGEQVVFASALFFRQDGLRLTALPFPRVDAPQFQLHFCTLDEDGVPSVLIRSLLVPGWFAPGARLVTRQPARAATLTYPRSTANGGAWTWEVRKEERLVVDAEIGPPMSGSGPVLGSWDQTVSFFRRRGLGFTDTLRGLRKIEIESSRAEVTPVRANVIRDGLLNALLAELQPAGVPDLHSAWLCAPMMISYELSGAESSAVGSSVPAPG